MNHLTPADLLSIYQIAEATIIVSIIIAFFFASFIYSLYRKIVRAINVPERIKTESGYLYRANNGLYVTKERQKELQFEFQLKFKQRAIRHHTRMLERLESAD